MRLSTLHGDRGYWKPTVGVRVFLDGVEQKFVVLADEELGLIVRHKVGADGRQVIDRAKQSLVVEEARGVVRIELPDGHPLKYARGAA